MLPTDSVEEGESVVVAPSLLQLPLKIRSSNFHSTAAELLDVEYALQSAALDPIGMGIHDQDEGVGEGGQQPEFGPREPIFLANAEFNVDAPCATLSANTRCVLAALLRCGSLGLDALPGHLTKKEILSKLGNSRRDATKEMEDQTTAQTAGESTKGSYQEVTESERMLRRAMDLANVGPVTRRLIDALDWADIEVDLPSSDFDRAISEALRRTQSTIYPTPPVEVFSFDDDENNNNSSSKPPDRRRPNPSKGTTPGRLLSVLFAHMARLRTPPSMMRLWLSFVEELRGRWDRNESLPNLGYVPGLDTTTASEVEICREDEKGRPRHERHRPHWGLQRSDTRVLGHRADHAAFVNSSEPDPDRDHCIIHQKLQVYNICIECKMSTEALYEKRMQNNGHQEDDSMMDSEDDDVFFDPEEEEEEVSFYKNSPARRQGDGSHDIERMLMLQAAVMNPGQNNRIGARCPVPDGMPLIESGDQLYAPYLQRTMPMSDVEIEKQKKFLGISKTIKEEERPSIRSRIAIAQRLQKPKLLSDMSSFKAANHGAVFEDFVRWYGNPENPLHEEISGETARAAFEHRTSLPSTHAKTLALEEASEAIAILMSLRAFWEDTWEESEPCPAFDQEPLFDPYSRAEMVLHAFETIHPAILMNQVLAVKLSNAKFVLESAAVPGGAGRVGSVARGLLALREAVDAALESLAEDALDGWMAPKTTTVDDESDPLVYVSTSTVAKCEEACNVVGELEILLSRALSLLRKFPGEYELVDTLLRCRNNVLLERTDERSAFLEAFRCHESDRANDFNCPPPPEVTAIPAMKEYVLRNVDSSNPCQLSARLVPDLEEAQSASLFHGSLLLALTKSSHN